MTRRAIFIVAALGLTLFGVPRLQADEPAKKALPPGAVVEADPYDLDLEANIATPAIEAKRQKDVKKHMEAVAQRLRRDGLPAEGTDTVKIAWVRDGLVVKVTIPIRLLFTPNDTLVRSDAYKVLSPLARYLKRPQLYKVLMAVHSDDTGDPLWSDNLTQARAENIDAYMQRVMDIKPSPLIAYAMGREDPADTNATRVGRNHNRRVEFFIVPQRELIDHPKQAK